MNFWNTFYNLCIDKGVAPNAVAKELGISSATITFWKKGERNPSKKALRQIADYFGVSVSYLLGNGEKEKTPDENNLTEGEKMLLQLFRQVPEEKQPHLIQLIKVALGMQ